MLADDAPLGNETAAPTRPIRHDLRAWSDRKLCEQILQWDACARNCREDGDIEVAEHYERLVDLVWSEAAHRKTKRRRRLGAV